MKIRLIVLILALIASMACQNTDNENKEAEKAKTDAGQAEVKKYYSEGRLVKELTFQDGRKNGICRNYYDDGRLKRTIWYKNDLKTDTAKWFYKEGMVYRATPYKNDKIHGIQTKYYKNGRVQARLPYRDGLRLQGLEEFLPDGREAEKYPEIKYSLRDLTGTDAGILKVMTQLTNESVNVRFYRGPLIDGAFDPEKSKDITASSGMGYLELRPDNVKGKDYVDIIAVYSSRFRNKKIITKRIKLPYNNFY